MEPPATTALAVDARRLCLFTETADGQKPLRVVIEPMLQGAGADPPDELPPGGGGGGDGDGEDDENQDDEEILILMFEDVIPEPASVPVWPDRWGPSPHKQVKEQDAEPNLRLPNPPSSPPRARPEEPDDA